MTTRFPPVRWIFLGVGAALVGGYLLLPTLFIIPMSFNAAPSLGTLVDGWTLDWYRELFTDPQWGQAAGVSLEVGLSATALATVLGTAAALGLERVSSRFRSIMRGLSMGPLIIPPVIIGVGMYVMFLSWHLYGTLASLIVAHSVLTIPFVIVAVGSSLAQFDPNLSRAAASLGAGPFTRFRRIVLPQIAPGVIAGALFAFVTSWDEIVVSTFLTSPALKTLPVQMWVQARTTVTPVLAALSTLLMLISTLALLGMWRLQRGGMTR